MCVCLWGPPSVEHIMNINVSFSVISWTPYEKSNIQCVIDYFHYYTRHISGHLHNTDIFLLSFLHSIVKLQP